MEGVGRSIRSGSVTITTLVGAESSWILLVRAASVDSFDDISISELIKAIA